MVEAIANSLENTFIDGLSCKLGKTTSYITNRRGCTFHPQRRNMYSSKTGTQLIKKSMNVSD